MLLSACISVTGLHPTYLSTSIQVASLLMSQPAPDIQKKPRQLVRHLKAPGIKEAWEPNHRGWGGKKGSTSSGSGGFPHKQIEDGVIPPRDFAWWSSACPAGCCSSQGGSECLLTNCSGTRALPQDRKPDDATTCPAWGRSGPSGSVGAAVDSPGNSDLTSHTHPAATTPAGMSRSVGVGRGPYNESYQCPKGKRLHMSPL